MNTAVYNNLLTTYDKKYLTKSVHNSSELKTVVKKIRKLTQTSPIYLLNFNDKKQSFVLGVKEASMKINDSLQMLAQDSDDGIFLKKKAFSSDIDQVGAELIDDKSSQLPSAFSIRVKQIADSQVNVGKEFYETGKGLSAGSYQFKVNVNDIGYDFQYNIKKDANHRDVISGLTSFISKAKIGVNADAYSTEKGKIGIRLESTMVGSADDGPTFSLEDKNVPGGGKGIVEYYGLNNIAKMPKSAVFDLNGNEKTSITNEFTLGKAIKVNLRKPSNTEAEISYRPDTDAIMAGINDFVSAYNDLIDKNIQFSEDSDSVPKLMFEMRGLMHPHENELESVGIGFDKNGYMQLDSSLAEQAIMDGDMKKLFAADSPFTNRLFAKTDAIKINPMEYIDKKIVNYPDFSKPPRGFSYITSLYSGLLFNYYC